MNKNQKIITNSSILDNLLINFPLWFPLIYIFLVFNFPSTGKIIFLASIFLFAETHFASTWLFFFDSENWKWIKKNLYQIVFIPIYVIFSITFIWQYSPFAVIFIHYLASGWHVTKQSVGIMNIYGNNRKIYHFLIYLASFVCLAVGLNNPGLFARSINLNNMNSLIFVVAFCYVLLLILNLRKLFKKNLQLLMPLITGIFIYLPILFFEDLATATAVGVGMHWCQYLAIVWSKYFRKRNFIAIQNSNRVNGESLKFLFFIFSYSLIMSSFSLNGIINKDELTIQYNIFYLIPLLFQLYHFYIDGFIWKFSDPQIKKSVLPFMFSNTK